MINEAYNMVAQFQEMARQPVSSSPKQLDKERVSIRAKWMKEEIEEFLEADNIDSQADALTDLLYYLLGTYVEMGVRPDDLFYIVHNANMQKLQTRQGIIKDENGKVQKPISWKHPDINIRDLLKDEK